MPFTFIPQELDGVVLVESRQFGDERGLFFETFKASEFEANGLPSSFAQDNQSRSRPGVIRGLHFQRAPHGQGKLVAENSNGSLTLPPELAKGASKHRAELDFGAPSAAPARDSRVTTSNGDVTVRRRASN